MRVISLIASGTEIVCALGRGGDLVGRSHECDFPPEAAGLPVCTAPRFDVGGSSAEIDARVRGLVGEGLSVYEVFAEQLEALRPDVVVTQTQCEVCAVSLRDVEEALARMTGGAPRVVSCAPNALAEVWDDIRRVADAIEAGAAGAALVDRLQARMDAIAKTAAESPGRPRVALIEWIDPLMAAGNWMPELVAMANGDCLFGAAGAHSPGLDWDALRAADPDVIAVMPCGWDQARAAAEMGPLAAQPGWAEMRAVREGRVYLADGNQYFNRPGPRLAESLEILAEMLHPDRFDFGHRGAGWSPWRP